MSVGPTLGNQLPRDAPFTFDELNRQCFFHHILVVDRAIFLGERHIGDIGFTAQRSHVLENGFHLTLFRDPLLP